MYTKSNTNYTRFYNCKKIIICVYYHFTWSIMQYFTYTSFVVRVQHETLWTNAVGTARCIYTCAGATKISDAAFIDILKKGKRKSLLNF